MPLLITLLAQRRQPIARQPDAKGDLLGQLLRQLLILFHCGRPRTITSHYHISVIKIIVSCNCYICCWRPASP